MTYKEEIRRTVVKLLEQESIHTQEEVVLSIFEMMGRISSETATHCIQVGKYSEILAAGMGMPADKVKELKLAAMLHDLGKIVLPTNIVEKPGKLTPEEYEMVKRHVIHGYDFLVGASGETLRLAAQVALEHHERWDGEGYLRKRGSDVCLEARIVSVADVFDALISERCYKKPWPLNEAREEIIRHGGTQFDPTVTKVFERCIRKVFEAIPA